MNDFIKGFVRGVKNAPLIFFAPAIAIWRLLVETTDSLLEKSDAPHPD